MSYTMSRQPEFFDLKAMFELTVELKLDGIDLVTLYNTDACELRKMADDFGISVVCHTFYAPLNATEPVGLQEAIDDAKRGIEAAVTLGAPVAMIPTLNSADIDRRQDRQNWIAGLRQVVPVAQQAGIVLTVENFPGEFSGFVIADDFLAAHAEMPDLRLTYDNGNAATGEDPVESFTRCAQYVVHSHFKDWDISKTPADGYRRMLDGKYYKPALIGEGGIDHRSCLEAMKSAGYDGYINIEYEGNKYRPDEAVRRAADHLRQIDAGQ